jgi:uncharacterized RDD family membrane protein YckC
LSAAAPPIPDTLASAAVALPPDRAIGSVGRRFIAFLIDGAVVWLACYVLTWPFFKTLSDLGGWGRLVGFCVALPYFAILNSRIGGGQTLGKELTHLQVVDRNGNTISFWRSLARYALLAVPYFTNDITINATRAPWIATYLLGLAIFGLDVATSYLVLFNRRTRQGVHDLAVGSYVADATKSGPVNCQPIWDMHWIFLGFILLFAFLGSIVLGEIVGQSIQTAPFLEDFRVVAHMDGFRGARMEKQWSFGNKGRTTTLVVKAYWKEKKSNEEAVADEIAQLILQHDPKIQGCDALRIVMIRGYDIGIANAYVSDLYQHTPAEWKARLSETSTVEEPPANNR